MNTLQLEAERMEIIREITHCSESMLNRVRALLRAEKKQATDKTLTQRMIAKYAGAWEDNRNADDIINDIYNSRLSHKEETISPFDK